MSFIIPLAKNKRFGIVRLCWLSWENDFSGGKPINKPFNLLLCMFGITFGDIFLVLTTALAVSAIELTIGALWIPRFVFAWVRANLSDLIEDINDDPDAQRIIGELMEKMQEHVKKLIGGYIGKMKQSARPQDMLMQLLMHAGVGWAQQQGFIPPAAPPPPQP